MPVVLYKEPRLICPVQICTFPKASAFLGNNQISPTSQHFSIWVISLRIMQRFRLWRGLIVHPFRFRFPIRLEARLSFLRHFQLADRLSSHCEIVSSAIYNIPCYKDGNRDRCVGKCACEVAETSGKYEVAAG